MKKFTIFLILCFAIIISILGVYAYSVLKPSNVESFSDTTLEDKILNNSTWLSITKDDLNGYLNGTYTKNVTAIIDSLEEATPIIFQTSSDRFSNIEGGIFVVASAFSSTNEVYIYYYNPETNQYKKTTATLESLLDDCTSAFIYTGTEEL